MICSIIPQCLNAHVQLSSAKLAIRLKNPFFGFEKTEFFEVQVKLLVMFLMNQSEKPLELEFFGMYCRIILVTFSTAFYAKCSNFPRGKKTTPSTKNKNKFKQKFRF